MEGIIAKLMAQTLKAYKTGDSGLISSWEDPEKKMATLSSNSAWKFHDGGAW